MQTRTRLLVSPFLFLVLIAALFSTISSAPARTYYQKATPAPAPVDRNDRITVLGLASVTVTMGATGQSVEYKVTSATKITLNGQPVQLNGLAVGMDVKVTTPPNEPTSAIAIDAKTPGAKGKK